MNDFIKGFEFIKEMTPEERKEQQKQISKIKKRERKLETI
jgi:hypothetical protein